MQTPDRTPAKRKLEFQATPAAKQPCKSETYLPDTYVGEIVCDKVEFLRSAIYDEQCPKLLAYLQAELQKLSLMAERTLHKKIPDEPTKKQLTTS